jgi:hypothetical protein
LEERLSNLEQSKKELNYDLLLLQSQQTVKKYTKEDIKQQLETCKKNLRDKNIAVCRNFIRKFILSATISDNGIEYEYSLDTVGADKGT